jgi:hypothetical protein
MTGGKSEPFVIYELSEGASKVFATEGFQGVRAMMANMWACDMGGWLGMALMSGAGFLVLLALLLAILALGRYVLDGPRHASRP